MTDPQQQENVDIQPPSGMESAPDPSWLQFEGIPSPPVEPSNLEPLS